MNISPYLFADPVNGSYLWLVPTLAALLLVVSAGAAVAVRRSGYIVVRRRARRLRGLTLWTGLALCGYYVLREIGVGFVSWRIWVFLTLLFFGLRLLRWIADLRSLDHDKVVERQARQSQTYFRKRSRQTRPAKRRKRRS